MSDIMNSRERIERAWRFEEPDRVPIEMYLGEETRKDPRARRLCELIDEYADNWHTVGWWPFWGWFGMDAEPPLEEVIDERPGEYKRVRHTRRTADGDFTAVTYHPSDSIDYHWEKRYISTLDDLDAITCADHSPRRRDAVSLIGDARRALGPGAFITASMPHPFGTLVRLADHETIYSWLALEPERIHRFLDVLISQIVAELDAFAEVDEPVYFMQFGMEMAVPPWMGHRMFDEFIVPYDSRVYSKIHEFGGKLRHHCHGNCMDFLVKMADMGIDGIEPLEPPPQGNVVLKDAKRLVGDRMLLCGNITSPQFETMTGDDVEEQVRRACEDAKKDGGFILRTTGGDAGAWNSRDLGHVLEMGERMMEAALRYGRY